MSSKICVIGNFNADLTAKAPKIPGRGETVMGHDFAVKLGGKGSNQAVAAYKSGADVIFAVRLGKDAYGEKVTEYYRSIGMDTSGIIISETEPTPVALIMVDENTAENCILVSSGSNMGFTSSDEDFIKTIIDKCDIILFQLEILPEINYSLMKYASSKGKRVILNTAPATELPDDLYPSLWCITPNEHEAALMTGIEITDESSLEACASALLDKGVRNVVITLGSNGSYIYSAKIKKHINAITVDAVDTTGAGDTFNGALAASLAEGNTLTDAAVFASYASAISVTRRGAAESAPERKETDLFILQKKISGD